MSVEGELQAVVTVTVPYQDADPAGVAWHGNYFRYFDTARCALLEKIDYGYRQMDESGFFWPIIDAQVRFIHPARYDDVLEVEATLIESEYRLKIAYVVRDRNGRRITKGHTIQVAVAKDSGELLLGSPAALLDRLEQYERNSGGGS